MEIGGFFVSKWLFVLDRRQIANSLVELGGSGNAHWPFSSFERATTKNAASEELKLCRRRCEVFLRIRTVTQSVDQDIDHLARISGFFSIGSTAHRSHRP